MRCEIKGERYAAVAKAMHLSERQVFRERKAALSSVAQRLLALNLEETAPAVTVARDALDARIALGEALENAGQWQAAADVFERLADEMTLPEQRSPLEARLARIYRDADRFAAAHRHANLASALAARAASDGDLLRVESDVTLAGVTAASGDWKRANALVQQSIDRLRPWTQRSSGARVSEALVQALLLRAELLVDDGGVDRAYKLASEARSVAGRYVPAPATEIAARTMFAVASILSARDPAGSEALLLRCYRDALEAGLIRGSVIIAVHLSMHYRIAGRPAEVLALLAPLLGAARVAGSGWVYAGVLCQLTSASLNAGELDTAAAYIAELSKCPGSNPLTRAAQQLLSAQCHLVREEFRAALADARAAEAVYGRIGLGRYLGIALRVEAEALSGMGESEPAERTIAQAIEILRDTHHPRPLAGAYRAMARITRRPQYAGVARRLLREIGQ